MARGAGCFVERETVPLVKISCLVTIRTDTPVDRVLGILARPLASVGRRRMLTCWCSATIIERLANSVGRYEHEDPHPPKTA
jgi:hypothetical protein